MEEFSLHVVRTYMVNVLRAAQANRSVRSELVEWTEREESFLDTLGVRCVLRDGYRKKSVIHNIKRAVNALERKTRRPPAMDPDANATRLVVRRFSLGPAAAALLKLAHSYTHCNLTNEIWDKLKQSALKPLEMLAVLLRLPRRKIEKGFRELARSGISDWKVAARGHVYYDPDDFIFDWFLEVWHPPVRDMCELTARLVGNPCNARLSPSDFEHVTEREDLQRTLNAAKCKRCEGELASGLNILLYGRPGTGKTEFAKTIAESAGISLFSVDDSGIGDEETCDSERDRKADYRNKLRMAQTLLRSMPEAAILCDEAEDALEATSGSRVANHRLIEKNPVPVIYTANSLKELDESMLRRFSHIVRFTAHGPTRQAAMVNGDVETIRRNIAQKAKLRHGVLAPDNKPIAKYDPALVHADVEMQALTERIASMSARRFAMCLCGPPGTGKTAYVGHIAERMGMDLLPKRASDLLSKWVGQTEQQIAGAFAEAVATQSFLVFDEVDSLLMDREFAVRSWETSMVNELLSQMERHPLPFACTTNRREVLDPAAARRFLFRVEFFYMDRQRVEKAFKFFYGYEAPPEVLALDKLTPADFANVREQAKILNFLDDPERIGRALADERRAKPGGGRMGFR